MYLKDNFFIIQNNNNRRRMLYIMITCKLKYTLMIKTDIIIIFIVIINNLCQLSKLSNKLHKLLYDMD